MEKYVKCPKNLKTLIGCIVFIWFPVVSLTSLLILCWFSELYIIEQKIFSNLWYYIEKMVVFYICLLTERLQHNRQKQKFGLQGLGVVQCFRNPILRKVCLKPIGEKNILTDVSTDICIPDKSYFSQHEYSGWCSPVKCPDLQRHPFIHIKTC